jgi:uncharacterized membrane protein
MTDPLLILAVLGVNVALSEWLARRTWLRHLGSALLVIVLTAVAANTGLIPAYSDEIPIYSGVFEYLAPLAIFLLLLRVNLRGILQAGLPMLTLFLLGSAGTVAGVLCGMWAVGGADAFGALHWALGGMFVGTYTGGSINYNAIALEYGVVKEGGLYAGAAAVDSAMTTVWMAVTVALPRLLARWWPSLRPGAVARMSPSPAEPGEPTSESGLPDSRPDDSDHDTETVSPFDLAVLLAMGAAAVAVSNRLGGITGIPSVLILTTVALLLAQGAWVQRLRGTRVAGWITVMLFLAVIGALCDIAALRALGGLGLDLLLFVTVVLLVHGTVLFGLGALLRLDLSMAVVASQANIGGSTTALALARSLGRGDLVLPGILVGALGNGLGTYLGFLTAAWLR